MAGRVARGFGILVLVCWAGVAIAGSTGNATETGPEPGRRVYFQYPDASGNLHFVESLEAVPAERRADAVRIELELRPKPRKKEAAPAKNAPRRRPFAYAPQPTVIVYTAPWCGWCRKTLVHLDAKGVTYVVKDVEASAANRDELIRKAGRATIPVIDIDGALVRGFEPTRIDALLARGQ